MTAPASQPDTTSNGSPTIRIGPAIGTWAISWTVGMVLVAPLVIVALGAELGGDLSIPQLGAATLAAWTLSVAALVFASRRFGTGDFVGDYAVRFRTSDLLGIPLGIVTQLGAIPLLYVPLQNWWPDTFSDERLEERARDLADQAGGGSTVLLILIVVVGAPIVEELVYRGLLQRSIASVIGQLAGLVVVSLWFMIVHPSPVEYPGLLVAGLVFGGCVVATGRVGTSMVAHAAFNATGLAVVLASVGW